MSDSDRASNGDKPVVPHETKTAAAAPTAGSEDRLTANTTTNEEPDFTQADVSIRRVLPSIGPRRISLAAGAKVHMHSENNHT